MAIKKSNTSTCINCEKSFEIKRKDSSGKFCSRECSDKTNKNQPARWFEKLCSVCGNSYRVKSECNAKLRKTCSRKCAAELKKIYGKEHPLYKRIDMACELCGKVKAVKPAKVNEFRFCSRRCLGTSMAKNQPKISSIELLMKSQFDAANLQYEQQFIIDYFITDFAFPESRLVVECDGVYWHGNDKQKAKDRQKDGFLKHHGWQILRLGELEIKENSEACLNLVLAKLQNQQAVL